MPQIRDRTRKISLQNDYAYCIISPVSPSVVPIQQSALYNHRKKTPAIQEGHFTEDFLDPTNYNNIEVAEEAYASLETNTPSRSFRRWSFCNFQVSGIPVSPSVTEATALEFGSNDGYGFKISGNEGKSSNSSLSSGRSSASSSSTSLNWLTERIRKVSTEKNKFDAKSMQENEEFREQMKKMVVY